MKTIALLFAASMLSGCNVGASASSAKDYQASESSGDAPSTGWCTTKGQQLSTCIQLDQTACASNAAAPRSCSWEEGPSAALSCTGTWGAMAALNADSSKLILRAPGGGATEYMITDIQKTDTQTTYVVRGASLIVAGNDAGGPQMTIGGQTWPLNFGCKTLPVAAH